jgi:hypothetical protein
VLKLFGVGDLQHLGAVLGQRARHDVAGDDVGRRQHPQARQRTCRRREWLGIAVADLDDFHQRLFGELLALRVGRPFFGCADDGEDELLLSGRLVEFHCVPIGHSLGDALFVRRASQGRAHAVQEAGVSARRQEEPAVLGLIQIKPHRVAQEKGQLIGIAVDRRHELVQRIDAVDGLAKVEAQVLANAAALTPDVRDPRRPGHDRDADARPEPMYGRENRILANESYCAASVFGR